MGKNRMIINTGTTSLIMIFGVLALVTFAAMSLSAAGAGWRMAEKMAERTSAYYQAEEESMKRLLQLEQKLRVIGKESSPETFEEHVREAVEDWEDAEWEDGCVCWEIPLQERQVFAAAVRPSYEAGEEESFREIVTWNVRSREPWENEQTLELLGTGS